MSTRSPDSESATTSSPEPSRSPTEPATPAAPPVPEPTGPTASGRSPAAAPPDEPGAAAPTPPAAAADPAPGSEFSAAELRALSEDIAEAFPLVTDATELVLVDVDPQRVHAHWAVQPRDLAAARAALGPAGPDADLVLRLHDLTVADGEGVPVHPPLDIDVDGLQNDWYIDLWSDAGSYLAELGLRGPDGRFVQLVQSNPVRTPSAAAASQGLAPALTVVARLATAAEAAETGPALQADLEAELPSAPDRGEAAPTDEPPDRTLHIPASQILETEFPDLGGGEPTPPLPVDAILWQPEGPPNLTVAPVQAGIAASATAPPARASSMPAAQATGETAPAVAAGSTDWSLAAAPTAELAPQFPNVDPGAAERGGEPPRPMAEQPAGGDGGATPPIPEPTGPSEAEHGPMPAPAYGGMGEPVPGSLLSYSSSSLVGPAVDLELHVELHVYGRARPGAELNLFGRRVALRPDGSFSFRRPLRNGAIVVPVLFADQGGPLEDMED